MPHVAETRETKESKEPALHLPYQLDLGSLCGWGASIGQTHNSIGRAEKSIGESCQVTWWCFATKDQGSQIPRFQQIIRFEEIKSRLWNEPKRDGAPSQLLLSPLNCETRRTYGCSSSVLATEYLPTLPSEHCILGISVGCSDGLLLQSKILKFDRLVALR